MDGRLKLEQSQPKEEGYDGCPPEDFQTLKNTLCRLLSEPTAREKEANASVQRCITVLEKQGKVELADLADLLCSQGFRAVLRTAPGGGHGMDCFKKLAYRFICLEAEGDTGSRPQILVDPHFKEQFCMRPSQKWYEDLLEAVPDVFVGPPARLIPLVHLLCGTMDAVFQMQGCSTPPWRKNEAVISKYIPKQRMDVNRGPGNRHKVCLSSNSDSGKTSHLSNGEGADIQQLALKTFDCPLTPSVFGFNCTACEALTRHLSQDLSDAEKPASN